MSDKPPHSRGFFSYLRQREIDAPPSRALRVWLLAGLSIGAAALSWHLLEKPLAKFKPRLPRGKRALSSPSPPPGGTARRCVAPDS